jgi:Domain of unknown function (DUF4288)
MLMEALHPDETQSDEPLLERNVILFAGSDEAEVLAKAQKFCENYSLEYRNVESNRVRWVCREVTAVNELFLEAIGDGAEVFSEFLPPRPAGSLEDG